ncbi:MAG: tetratricopeptide repeat protein [Thermoanaerobaculia bacterium]
MARTAELERGLLHLEPLLSTKPSSTVLQIEGESGVGKSFFLGELLYRFLVRHSDALCLYVDLSADEFLTTSTFQALLHIAWNPIVFSRTLPCNVPDGIAFSQFLEGAQAKDSSVKRLYSAALTATSLFPAYGPVLKDLLPQPHGMLSQGERLQDSTALLFAYLQRTAKDRMVVLAIDNYQFLPGSIRLLLEARLETLQHNLGLVVVQRTTNEAVTIDAPRCFREAQLALRLQAFTLEETRRFISETAPVGLADLDQLARDSFSKTRGNAKELDYYARALELNRRAGSPDYQLRTFVDTIGTLPPLQRNIVAISALFPAGMEITFVLRMLQKRLGALPDREVREVVANLVALGYIVLNSAAGRVLRPGHEKVLSAIKRTMTEEELLELRQAARSAFEELLVETAGSEHTYLLHCLVGILNVHELTKRLNYVIELLDRQYRASNYRYIVWVYQQFPTIVSLLPESALSLLFDAFQKTSEFYLGLAAIARLRAPEGSSLDTLRSLYSAKFLTQTYRCREAVDILERLPESDEVFFYRVLAHEYLGRHDRVRQLLDRLPTLDRGSPFYHLTHRNTTHYVGYDAAVAALHEAIEYFDFRARPFEKATVLNNLGVAHLWFGALEDGENVLSRARDIFRGIGSNEVYQPLLNLGVLAAMRTRYDEAVELFKEAGLEVPKPLLLDGLILEVNLLIVRLCSGGIDLAAAVGQLETRHEEARTIEDPLLHDQLAYNLTALRTAPSTPSQAPSRGFLEALQERRTVGVEVVMDRQIEGRLLRPLLSLSPHWRY